MLLSLDSANRDAYEFEDADWFVFNRFPNLHTAFRLGMDICVGSHFARLLFEAMLLAVLERLSDYEVIEVEAQGYHMMSAIHGWAKMPVRFTPGQVLGAEGDSVY